MSIEGRIIDLLCIKPMNVYAIAKELKTHSNTVKYQIIKLVEEGVIEEINNDPIKYQLCIELDKINMEKIQIVLAELFKEVDPDNKSSVEGKHVIVKYIIDRISFK